MKMYNQREKSKSIVNKTTKDDLKDLLVTFDIEDHESINIDNLMMRFNYIVLKGNTEKEALDILFLNELIN